MPSIENENTLAVIGMAGRFPHARNVDELWQLVRDGVEAISTFSAEELRVRGVDPTLLENPHYVRASGVVENAEGFDAAFFGYSAEEAQLMDPQQRILLECAWETLESAGYDSSTYDGIISLYAGASTNTYFLNNIYPNPALVHDLGSYRISFYNEPSFLSTRVSYKMNLKGPSVYLNSACSTSLVAVHQACQSLLSGESDMALAGGVSLRVPQIAGYLYHEDGLMSPDGHCRAFDAQARGYVSGSGVGLVLLKRLEDALADGDVIHALILGSAVNNDGANKIGFTAPSVDGQVRAAIEAMSMAGIEAHTITYVEAHGTGTDLGDSLELAALTKAFRSSIEEKNYCAIGSLKTNIGHLDAASGIASLIKVILALEHQALPASLNFEHPNPRIDFASSPFYVNTTLTSWNTDRLPRRAGVNSIGVGGTNAYVVLEEAPSSIQADTPCTAREHQLVVLSAKTTPALEAITTNLAAYLKQHTTLSLPSLAYTCQVGRQAFNYRRAFVCHNLEDARQILETRDPERLFSSSSQGWQSSSVAFVFPGQGSEYVGMGQELYRTEPLFREYVDTCANLLIPHLGLDIREIVYPSRDQGTDLFLQLDHMDLTQPILFVIEYALAQLWIAWGIVPQALIGQSIGEYVAACLAGVFSLEEALTLLAAQVKMLQTLPTGATLAVSLSASEVGNLLGPDLSIAAILQPTLCLVSGPIEAVEHLEAKFQQMKVGYERLKVSYAVHSAMMDPLLEPLTAQLKKVHLQTPQIPYLSNVTGTWITDEQATEPTYWTNHLRATVRFFQGIEKLLQSPRHFLLEVGPASTFCRTRSKKADGYTLLPSLPAQQERIADEEFLLKTLAQLWLAGIQPDWTALYNGEHPRRLSLPTYPFERQRYWIEPPGSLYQSQ